MRSESNKVNLMLHYTASCIDQYHEYSSATTYQQLNILMLSSSGAGSLHYRNNDIEVAT